MVDLSQPAEPLEGWLISAAACELTCRTDPSAVGINPQTHQQPRIPWRAPRAAFNRLNGRIEPLQLQTTHQLPDSSGRMVRLNEPFDIQHLPGQLTTIDRFDSRLNWTSSHRRWHWRARNSFQTWQLFVRLI